MYVVIICDTSSIMYENIGTQNRIFCFLYLTEGTDIVVNSIEDDDWEDKYELTGALNEGDEIWD